MKSRNMFRLLVPSLIFLGAGLAPAQCILLNCPDSLKVCPEGGGAVVHYDITATATCGTNVTVTCEPPSGSWLPLGTNFVSCTATNELGDSASCRFPVIVGDREPPVLIFPARTVSPCVSPDGAVVHFSVVAVDNCDTNVVIVCDPPSGSVFPVGTTTVTCTATDASGNQTRKEFPILVAGGCGGDRCVRLTVPADLTVPCTTSSGASVQFTATATNTCTGASLPVVCTPPSGSVLPVGLHQVVCVTGEGATALYASFLVEVTDDVPPTLHCPSNLVVAAQSPLGAVVFYAVHGEDDCASNVLVRCSPPSGSAFPVGKTQVFCEGSDGHGNLAQCGFEVEVTPPPPLTAQFVGPQLVELRWTGDAFVEQRSRLDPSAPWEVQPGTIEAEGVFRRMRIPAAASQQFFRIAPLPLLPPPDEDGDGVPDDKDRCPGTFAGARVDRYGCADLDVLGAPEGIFEPDRALAQEAVRLLILDGGFARTLEVLLPALEPSTDPVLPLLDRLLLPAVQAQSNHMAGLREALQEFQRRKPLRMTEIISTVPQLEADHADFRPQDLDLMRLDDIEVALLRSLEGSEHGLNTLSNLHAATLGAPTRQRVQIQSFDERRGVARLADGRRLLLPRPGAPGDPPFSRIPVVVAPGSLVDIEFFPSADGSLLGQTTTPVPAPIDDLVHEVDPRCLRLRFVPAEVGLHLWDSGKRHNPLGYFWGNDFASSRYYLEQGMGLAVVKVSCPYETPGAYRHWVKIMKDGDNDGNFVTAADYIDEHSFPVVMTPEAFPDGFTFPMIVREYRAPELGGGALGPAELVAEETFMLLMRPWGYFASAVYSRTIFELEDVPASSEWQSASVTALSRRYPLTLNPAGEHAFLGGGYEISGNNSSFPTLKQIDLNEPFAVHVKDPNDDAFFAYPNDIGRGLYSPMVRGKRHGLPHQYRATLPTLVRDRIAACPNTDTYYRIPFDPVTIVGTNWIGGTWSVSQGNNGTFTHNGWQAFAWDFPKPAGTPVRAARGGRVASTRSTSTQSCWNPAVTNCVNCSGAASPNLVTILHQDGTTGWYLHFAVNTVLVSPGQRVYRGDQIASVGTTGCSTGNHLHFHVVNPAGNLTIPSRFEAFDNNRLFRQCYNPPAQSNGWSNNEPW